MQYLAYYLAAINVVLYALMGLDKLFAKLQKRRIPEKTLFAFAIVGGATINARFIQENLVDEIRLVVAPFIDGSKELTITEMPDNTRLTKAFALDRVERLEHDGILIIYKRNK